MLTLQARRNTGPFIFELQFLVNFFEFDMDRQHGDGFKVNPLGYLVGLCSFLEGHHFARLDRFGAEFNARLGSIVVNRRPNSLGVHYFGLPELLTHKLRVVRHLKLHLLSYVSRNHACVFN